MSKEKPKKIHYVIAIFLLVGMVFGFIPFVMLGPSWESWQNNVIWDELYSGNYSSKSITFILSIIIAAILLAAGNVIHWRTGGKFEYDGSVAG